MRTIHYLSFTLLLCGLSNSPQAVEITGLVQANLIAADPVDSWQNKNTGILREDSDGIHFQQSILRLTQDITSGLSMEMIANYYQDGEHHMGITQSFFSYKPLSPDSIKWQARAGFFYPHMSLENVDIGWLSPYTYTQSAINSWIGEELRTAGLEFSIYSPGRGRKSPWSWELLGAAFKGNDPLGTIISWRGFAMHDRQSLHTDRVEFAAYPTVIDKEGIWHPSWVEPFHEIDGRIGYYVGAHLDYYRQSSLRYYYYDNRANPLAVNDQRLYGWRTKFHSLALQHNLSTNIRLIGQWLSGSSLMGARIVYIDFDAWYLMLSHHVGQSRVSLRYDHFKVVGDDALPQDPNNSDGYGITLAWRYEVDKSWQLGLEQHHNNNSAQNRMTLGQAEKIDQQQTLFVVQYKWQ